MVPVVGVDRTVYATEADKLSRGPPIPVPVPTQLGSDSGEGLETPPIVSDYAVLTIVVANYWSFSSCLSPLILHYRLHYMML